MISADGLFSWGKWVWEFALSGFVVLGNFPFYGYVKNRLFFDVSIDLIMIYCYTDINYTGI